MFLLGPAAPDGRQTAREGDLLVLPCPNTYPALPQADAVVVTLGTRTWRRRWDYLLKCDSDTWVHVPRLLAYARPAEST